MNYARDKNAYIIIKIDHLGTHTRTANKPRILNNLRLSYEIDPWPMWPSDHRQTKITES